MTFVPTHHIGASTLHLAIMPHSSDPSRASDAMISQAKAVETSRSTATTVLEIPELLEMILFQLPCLDIFILQRVSPVWQGIVKGSVSLRTALFLQPAKCTIKVMEEVRNAEVQSWSDHSSWRHSGVIRSVPDQNATAARMLEFLADTGDYVYLNPFVATVMRKRLEQLTLGSETRFDRNYDSRQRAPRSSTKATHSPRKRTRVPKGSWEAMPICSPPLMRKHAWVQYECAPDARLEGFIHSYQIPSGELEIRTLGNFAAFVEHHLEQWHTQQSCSSIWDEAAHRQMSFSFLRCEDDLFEVVWRES